MIAISTATVVNKCAAPLSPRAQKRKITAFSKILTNKNTGELFDLPVFFDYFDDLYFCLKAVGEIPKVVLN